MKIIRIPAIRADELCYGCYYRDKACFIKDDIICSEEGQEYIFIIKEEEDES